MKKFAKKIRLWLLDRNSRLTEEVPSEILPFPQPKEDALKLNIGGGKGHSHFKKWKIIDLRESSSDIIVDIAKEKLPFADNSIDVIFASHILEHIYPQQLDFTLGEFYRVLKPTTGLVRISVPNIKKAVEAYISKDYSFFANSSLSTYKDKLPLGGLLASWFYSTRVFGDPQLKHGDGHLHCFDEGYLGWWLKRAGFGRAWKSTYRGSIIDELRSPGFDLHKNDSLFVEAVK